MHFPDQNAYQKGCFYPSKFPRELLPKVFTRTMELSATPQYTILLLFEYFRLDKANSIPDGGTALRRNLTPNVLCLMYSQENSEVATKYSRGASRELLEMITGKSADNLGYGNYSKLSESTVLVLEQVDAQQCAMFRSRQRRVSRCGFSFGLSG